MGASLAPCWQMGIALIAHAYNRSRPKKGKKRALPTWGALQVYKNDYNIFGRESQVKFQPACRVCARSQKVDTCTWLPQGGTNPPPEGTPLHCGLFRA